jgi:geranylgeranyl diphosphate synthase type I
VSSSLARPPLAAAATAAGNPVDAEGLRERVDLALADFLDRQAAVLGSVSAELLPLVDIVRGFVLDGGKRFRAAFLYWGWRAAGGAPYDAGAVRAAAALELLQAAALVHDDLMDRSDTRRGRASMHRQFQSRHRAEGRGGDPASQGAASAVLAGDLLLTWSDALFSGCGLPTADARPVFDLLRTEVMAGQYLDMLPPAPGADLAARARTVVRYKSAKYTVERPLQLGALLAGGSPQLVAALGEFGLPLGEAFQLRDDLLGVFGDPARTGKPSGDDLREGKRTLLVAEALAHATPADARLIDDLLGSPEPEAVDLLRDALSRSGAPARVRARIADLRDGSLAALDAAPVTEPARVVLHRLAHAALGDA